MMIHTAISVQCSRTGRFLLRRQRSSGGGVVWEMTAQAHEDCFSPMMAMLSDLDHIIRGGHPNMMTYVDVARSDLHLYHCWMNPDDLQNNDGSYEWHGLYDLPDELSQVVEDALLSPHFMELILSS